MERRSYTSPRAPLKRGPHAHTLVVLGGTTVVAVGNATTAGVLLEGADDPTELDT